MRTYALVFPAFWTGTTGKAITAAGKDARIVATYLLTSEHANMLGLYRLPVLYAAEETGLKRREIIDAMEQLKVIGFADYDEATEFVWVSEMARFQLGLLPGEHLKEGDKRTKGAARLYKQIPSNPFLGPFHDRYSEVLGLPIKRDFIAETKPHVSPFEGASKPLARGYVPVPDPDSVRKGDTGETKNLRNSPNEITPEKIREDWNAIPGVKPCREIGKTIRERIQTRIKEHTKPEWWASFFQRVQASDFLCGRTNGKEGPFRASLDWVLGPNNLDKLLAGNYDPITSNGHSSLPTCTKRIQAPGDKFLRPCGQPASPESRPNEPRCAEHLLTVSQPQVVNHASR